MTLVDVDDNDVIEITLVDCCYSMYLPRAQSGTENRIIGHSKPQDVTVDV